MVKEGGLLEPPPPWKDRVKQKVIKPVLAGPELENFNMHFVVRIYTLNCVTFIILLFVGITLSNV